MKKASIWIASAAAASLLLPACYGGGKGRYLPPRGCNCNAWDASFEGFALDVLSTPVASVSEPVVLTLTPVGNDKYAVEFEGWLPFQLFDLEFNSPLGPYDLPLDLLNGARGDFLPVHGSYPNGVFWFWGLATVWDPLLGLGEMELSFYLAPDGFNLETSASADLIWDATLDFTGTLPYPFPASSRLRGFETIALRID